MLSIKNIDLTSKKNVEEDVKSIKSYIFQLYNELQFRLGLTEETVEVAKADTRWGQIKGNISNQTDLTEALNEKASSSSLTSHTSNTSNPHSVTKSQVGLGNVDNKSSVTIRGEITSSNVTNALGFTPYNASNPSGYAPLTTFKDYVVEQGVATVGSFSWRYRKWNSGQAEVQGAYAFSYNCNTQLGSAYYTSYDMPALPSWFTPANIQLTMMGTGLVDAKVHSYNSSTHQVKFFVYAPYSHSNSNTLWAYMRGSWS